MGSDSINEQVGTKKKTASVKYSVCMDTVGWISNGSTCDSLDGTSCDMKTEKAKPGVDLSAIGNDPASNCCACGKRGKGDQRAPTPASPNGSYCTKTNCLPSAGTLLPSLPEVTSQSDFWLLAMLSVLAMVTLMQLYKRRATVKFSSDDFLKAELIQSEKEESSPAKTNA